MKIVLVTISPNTHFLLINWVLLLGGGNNVLCVHKVYMTCLTRGYLRCFLCSCPSPRSGSVTVSTYKQRGHPVLLWQCAGAGLHLGVVEAEEGEAGGVRPERGVRSQDLLLVQPVSHAVIDSAWQHAQCTAWEFVKCDYLNNLSFINEVLLRFIMWVSYNGGKTKSGIWKTFDALVFL